MRVVSLVLLAFIALPLTAAKKPRVWVAGMFGAVTSGDWCGMKSPALQRACDVPAALDQPPPYRMATDSTISPDPPRPYVRPRTQLIQVEAPQGTYTVKYGYLAGPIPAAAGQLLEFSIAGKHLYLRIEGKVYKTDIVAVKKGSRK